MESFEKEVHLVCMNYLFHFDGFLIWFVGHLRRHLKTHEEEKQKNETCVTLHPPLECHAAAQFLVGNI